jgi:hypothetical protein
MAESPLIWRDHSLRRSAAQFRWVTFYLNRDFSRKIVAG